MRGQRRQVKRRLKSKSGRGFLIFIAIIPTHSLRGMHANPPGVQFLRAISKIRERKKIFLVVCLHPL